MADFAAPLSASEVSNVLNATLYPNPFRDQATINFDREINGNLEIADMNGKLCLKKSVSGNHINFRTEDLAPGIYMITVSDGKKIVYQTKGLHIAN
jgi:hypothetical protein